MNYTKWVAMWGSAVSINENRPESYGKNITLSYDIYCPFDGDKIRLTLDNYCGTDDITITRMSILYKESFYPVRFGGQESTSIAAGKQIVTDELPISVVCDSTLTVRIYLGEVTQLRSAVYMCGNLTSGAYGQGDFTACAEIPLDLKRSTNIFYFLSNISIHTTEENRCIVCYGDSITAQNWPDDLAIRCQKEGPHTAIIRRATSGSRILREYECITYESYGLKGSKRFAHEVPTDGCDTVIIQQGINDIIHPVGTDVNPFRPMSDLPTCEELLAGLQYYIDLAKSYGYKVYVGTLLPIEGWRTYADFREILRNDFNNGIRAMAASGKIDGCIDFDLATADTNHMSRFADGCDSGDHLHPSAEGYRRMASSVPGEIIK